VKLVLRGRLDRNIAIAFALAAAWFFLVLISPYLVQTGQLTDLSGRYIFMDNQAKLEGVNPLASVVYTIGDFNCHQLNDRSYFLNDNQLPFCARDVGIFAGLSAGALISLLFIFEMRWTWLLVGLIPMGFDGAVQALTSYDSTNATRFATGILAGCAVAIFICMKMAMPDRSVDEIEKLTSETNRQG